MMDGEPTGGPFDNQAPGAEDAIELDNPFWRFSLTVYGEESVQEVSLRAQDSFGADVNLMLLCCWVGFSGVRLDEKGVRRLDRLVDGWRREVIGPVRDVRRRLADAVGPMAPQVTKAFRETVKGAELQAEQIQQAVLFRALETLPGRDARQAERSGVARMNLTVYLRDIRGIDDAAVLRDLVETMVLGCRDRLEKLESEDGDEDAPD